VPTEKFSFQWDRSWNQKFCNYEISADGYNVAMVENVSKRLSLIISDKKVVKGTGIVEFRVIFSCGCGYDSVGIVYPSEVKNQEVVKEFTNDWGKIPSFCDSKYSRKEVKCSIDTNLMQVRFGTDKIIQSKEDELFIGIHIKHGSAKVYID